MRRVDRLLSLVLGVVLAAAAALAGVEIVLLAAGRSPLVIPRHSWSRGLHGLHWASAGTGIASGILLAVGAILFLLQLVPRKPVRMALRSTPGDRVFLSRRSLARRLSLDVADLDEVLAVKVRVTARVVRAKVALAAGVGQRAGADAARQALQATLAHVAVAHDLRVRVAATVKDPPVEKGSRRARLDDPNIDRPSTTEPEQAA